MKDMITASAGLMGFMLSALILFYAGSFGWIGIQAFWNGEPMKTTFERTCGNNEGYFLWDVICK